MQNLVWECWNQKGLNNTAVSEIVKLRASFPGVLTKFLPTTENMAKAMWSWIKSSTGDAFAKAPSTASAVWKLLVGFDIQAKFLFIHITRRSWYRPNLLLAENRAALLRCMEISRAFLLAFHGRQAEENLSSPNLAVHLHCSYTLAPSSPSEVIPDSTQKPGKVSNQNLIIYSHFFCSWALSSVKEHSRKHCVDLTSIKHQAHNPSSCQGSLIPTAQAVARKHRTEQLE